MESELIKARRPSRWWLAVSITCWLFAVGFLIAAYRFQSQASAPIGEGEVFVKDAETIDELIDLPMDFDEAVRHARNTLDVEAVSIVEPDGSIVASTSETLQGLRLENPLLGFGAEAGRFAAFAGPVSTEIEIDGVVAWPANSVLYQVVSPLSDGRSGLVHYDLSQLLARRTTPGQVQPETIQLLALGGVFSLLGAAVMIGHTRATKRYRDIALESELLREQSVALERANLELQEARDSAETALALAEEKVRVRSEFVLMINHELRTPLTSVVTGAELLRGGRLSPDDADQVIKAMADDGKRLQEIIDQILAVARIENRGLASDLSIVSFDEICRTVGASQGNGNDHLASRNGNVRVQTDLKALKLVVASLVDNAKTHGASSVTVQCSTDSAIEPMVEVGTPPRLGISIRVSDDGPGIPQDFLPRIFEKFEKSSFSPGTGLGLYMVRIMVEALRGSIAVTTSPDGTIFEIKIPAVLAPSLAVSR